MIVVLGAGGMLGSALTNELEKLDWESTCYSRQGLDVTDEIAIRRLFKAETPPSLIINCAAATDVDWCEKNPKNAQHINADSVAILSGLCMRYGTKLVQISTDYVFSGDRLGPYFEDDATYPLQAYGRTKLASEQSAKACNGYVFRIQWVYGPGRKNFTDWVIDSVVSGKKIPISVEQVGIPSSTEWLAKQICFLTCKLNRTGTYHVTHDDWCTRYEFAEYIARGLGKDPEACFDKLSGVNFGLAKRPVSTILGNQKVKHAAGLVSLGSWKTDLVNYITTSREMPFLAQ